MEGWLWVGAMVPDPNAPESSEVTDVDAGVDWLAADALGPRSLIIAATKAIRAATNNASFAAPARALAAAMRDLAWGGGELVMAAWNRTNVRGG